MPESAAGLTRHVRRVLTCTTPVMFERYCANNTWELCDKCSTPVCAMHILKHYRRYHPGML